MTTLIAAALACADRLGAGVVPINGKRPAADHGYASASADPVAIRAMFAAVPGATGFGICAGDRLVILDVDRVHALGEFGERVPSTLTTRSGGGGGHLYFTRPAGLRLSYRRDRFPVGVEVKLGHAGCVAPPSLHTSGRRYSWVRRMPPVPTPEWLLALLSAPEHPPIAPIPIPQVAASPAYGRAALERHSRLVATAPEGCRRSQLNGSAFALAQPVPGGYLTPETIADVLHDAAAATGLPVPEIRRTVTRALADGMRRPWFPEVAA